MRKWGRVVKGGVAVVGEGGLWEDGIWAGVMSSISE